MYSVKILHCLLERKHFKVHTTPTGLLAVFPLRMYNRRTGHPLTGVACSVTPSAGAAKLVTCVSLADVLRTRAALRELIRRVVLFVPLLISSFLLLVSCISTYFRNFLL